MKPFLKQVGTVLRKETLEQISGGMIFSSLPFPHTSTQTDRWTE